MYAGAISGLHLLPVYPSTGDGGFAPMTYQEINTAMGSWEDVERLCLKFEVMLELMPNHISQASEQFQDLKRNGEASATVDMWIDWTRFWQGNRIIQSCTHLPKLRHHTDSVSCYKPCLSFLSTRRLKIMALSGMSGNLARYQY